MIITHRLSGEIAGAIMRQNDSRVFNIIIFLTIVLLTSCGQSTPDYTQVVEKTEVPVVTQTPFILIVTATNIPETLTELPSLTLTPEHKRVKAKVIDVIDGDTIKVIIEGEEYSVRYIGVDSPEVQYGEWMGKEAFEANTNLVFGKDVYLERDVSETDRYNRLLRYVFLEDGTFVNAELVRLGVARAIAYPPDTKYQPIFEEMEQDARDEIIGIWKTTSTPEVTDTPTSSEENVQIISVDKKAEYVDIKNFGFTTVSLNGWMLRSEKGFQDCYLGGNLEPGITLRIWALAADDEEEGYNCGKGSNIWNNSEPDPAVLYNSSGEEVDRY